MWQPISVKLISISISRTSSWFNEFCRKNSSFVVNTIMHLALNESYTRLIGMADTKNFTNNLFFKNSIYQIWNECEPLLTNFHQIVQLVVQSIGMELRQFWATKLFFCVFTTLQRCFTVSFNLGHHLCRVKVQVVHLIYHDMKSSKS